MSLQKILLWRLRFCLACAKSTKSLLRAYRKPAQSLFQILNLSTDKYPTALWAKEVSLEKNHAISKVLIKLLSFWLTVAFLAFSFSTFLVFVNIFVKHVINHLVCMFALPQSITLMITLNQTLMPCKNLGWIGKINGSYTCWLTLLNISVPIAVTLQCTAVQQGYVVLYCWTAIANWTLLLGLTLLWDSSALVFLINVSAGSRYVDLLKVR